jgi:hypothetical protein
VSTPTHPFINIADRLPTIAVPVQFFFPTYSKPHTPPNSIVAQARAARRDSGEQDLLALSSTLTTCQPTAAATSRMSTHTRSQQPRHSRCFAPTKSANSPQPPHCACPHARKVSNPATPAASHMPTRTRSRQPRHTRRIARAHTHAKSATLP